MANTPDQLLVQPASACTSATCAASLCVDLKGWPEGQVTWAEWLDAGGPIDATDCLPIGGAWAHQLTFGVLAGGSVQRPGALA